MSAVDIGAKQVLIGAAVRPLRLDYELVNKDRQMAWLPIWCPDPHLEQVWPGGGHRGWFNFRVNEPATWWYHEILHYCVATPAQRLRPDFGLGRWPGAIADRSHSTPGYNRAWGSETLVTTRTATIQESHACNLYPTWSVLHPHQRDEMAEACGDFGTHDLTRRQLARAVRVAWDDLGKLFPGLAEAELVEAAWAEWKATED